MAAPVSDEFAKIHDILEQLDLLGQDPAAENRRQAPRVPLRAKLQVTVVSRKLTLIIPVYCRNISVSGIGFVSRRMFIPEERIAISLKLHRHPTKLVLARVVYAHYAKGGLYQTGAEFLECVQDPSGAAKIPDKWVIMASRPKEEGDAGAG